MAAQQHTLFQNYLAQSKDKFLKNLNVKIFPKTSIEDYEFMKTLGHGSYGQVVSARNIHDGKIFAVKIVKKKKMIREDQVKHLISEIRILNAIKFDFMIFLECYFTSSCNIFIVLPQITGGQFFKLLRKLKKLDENSAKFYAAQVVLAIEYLHYMGIVYRDLKPENMLLDTDGYLKLVDFGFSKHIGKSTTYTFCGTPEYIAPEILLSRGYSKSPDWWTLGILLYEMCNGTPPFTAKNELKLYEKILVGNINWPEHFSPALRSLVKGLLEVNKNKRLGCMKNKVEDVKFHEWFGSIDWNAVWNKQIPPPLGHNTPGIIDNDYIDRTFSFTKGNVCTSPNFGNIDYAI